MSKKLNVSFIGAGEIGTAISKLVIRSKANVEMWDNDPKKIPNQKPFDVVISSADILFFCVPSWVLCLAIQPAIKSLRKETICVFVSKGIEEKSLKFMDEVIPSLIPKHQPYILISGPMLAEELIGGKGGAALVATKNQKDFEMFYSLFRSSDLCLSYVKDAHSISVAGVLKNIYAITLGIADGLEWGSNRKGWLCVKAFQEIGLIMKRLHANPNYALSQAGLGDFIATGMSRYSANQTLGRELVKKNHPTCNSEGCKSLALLEKKLDRKFLNSLTLLCALHLVLIKNKNPKAVFEKLFCEK